jgi:hypothetical protein
MYIFYQKENKVHKDQLKNRQKFISATPLPDRATSKIFSRKPTNGITLIDDDSGLDQYDSFFDYEEGLSGLKSAGEQFAEEEINRPFIEMETSDEKSSKVEENTNSMTEEVLDSSSEPIIMLEPDTFVELEDIKKKTFEFKVCKHIKDDGAQCKRQAPKSGEYCSSHKKLHI